MTRVTTIEALEAIYGAPGPTSTLKELDHLIPEYRAYIEASPFCALATVGPEGWTAVRAVMRARWCG